MAGYWHTGPRYLLHSAVTWANSFIPAPNLARARWVQVSARAPVPPIELRDLLRRSYELVRACLPKWTQRDLAD